MKKFGFLGVFLFLFSQMSWAGLIELRGSGTTSFSSQASPAITFVTSYIIDTDTLDANADSSRGLFLNAIKSGFIMLSTGNRYELDCITPNGGDMATGAVSPNTPFAWATIRLTLNFFDALGEKLNLAYSSHTDAAFADGGFVGAGESLHGLENRIWFEGNGEMCIGACAAGLAVNTGFNTLAVSVATVAEPSSLWLFAAALLSLVATRKFKKYVRRAA